MNPAFHAWWSRGSFGPSITVRAGLGRWASPPASDPTLLNAAAASSRTIMTLSDTVRELRDHLGLLDGIGRHPLERLLAGATRPWLDPLFLSEQLRPPRSTVPTSLLPVLGAANIREASSVLTERTASRLVIRALGTLVRSHRELDLTHLSAAVLGARLDLADEQVAAILWGDREQDPKAVQGIGQRALNRSQMETAIHMLRDGDRTLTAELLIDAAASPYSWATFLQVLDSSGAHGARPVAPLASLERWVLRVNDHFVARHGDIPVGSALAMPLDGHELADGLRIELLHTVGGIARTGDEFDNCLPESAISLADAPHQYFVVRDADGHGVAVGHLRASSQRLRLAELLGPSNAPVTSHLREAVRAAICHTAA